MTTRTQYITYVHGTVGPKRRRGRENDVPDNEWFYGRVVWGQDYAWCLVKECHDMDHFGILELNGGKAAYVPNMPKIAKRCGAKVWIRPKRGSKAYEAGNRIGFDFNKSGEAEHTGTYWKPRDASTFYSIDANTGVDEVAVRIRRYADVLFVVETLGLDGGTTREDTDVPDYVSLATKKPVPVTTGTAVFVDFDDEISDEAKRHSDAGAKPALFVAGKGGSVYLANISISGPATWELCEMRKDGDEYVQHDHSDTGGPDLMDAGNHLWLKLHPTGDGSVTINRAKCVIWDR